MLSFKILTREVRGRRSTGEILSLDVTSVQNKPHAGNWLYFSYRLTGTVETRQNIAKTASCSGGKISSANPSWLIDKDDRKVLADSVGSQNLLQRVCQLGKASTPYVNAGGYTVTEYVQPSFDSPASYPSYPVIQNYLGSVNRLLLQARNPTITVFSDEQKIESGIGYCRLKHEGGTSEDIYRSLYLATYKEDPEEAAFFRDYKTTTFAAALTYFCPQYK
jgi:hypothetical protein